ncbi:MAG: hypothetical protein OHK0023_07740 [Anaerolineae bacterium]
MRRLLTSVVLVLVAALFVMPMLPTAAQQPPASFNDALADLGRRLGRTLTLDDFNNPTSRWEWRGIDFKDSALECPNANETVTVGTVTGYQFIFILRGVKYDYRVALNQPNSLRLCTNRSAGAQFEVTLPPRGTANTEPPAVLNDALADLNRRLDLSLTLDDFNEVGSRWAWQYREFTNSQLNCPAAGVTVDRLITPGWVITFVYKRVLYEYRVKLNDPSSLFLCRGG